VREECRLAAVEPDGALVLHCPSGRRVVELHGLQVAQPVPAEYLRIVQKKDVREMPLRIRVRGRSQSGREQVQAFVFGWQDKSGDVWVDLARVLIEAGAAGVADEGFPEREEYLGYQSRGREP
jgi:hypothetical protein